MATHDEPKQRKWYLAELGKVENLGYTIVVIWNDRGVKGQVRVRRGVFGATGR